MLFRSAFGTPSTIASRRLMATPQQNPQPSYAEGLDMPNHTPVQFPQLHLSPDVYHFGNFGPATAPVLPSSQILFKDQSTWSSSMFATATCLTMVSRGKNGISQETPRTMPSVYLATHAQMGQYLLADS